MKFLLNAACCIILSKHLSLDQRSYVGLLNYDSVHVLLTSVSRIPGVIYVDRKSLKFDAIHLDHPVSG